MTINNASTLDYQATPQSDDKLTVLIVDDSKVIRLALNKILKKDFIVLQANDGEDGWDKLSQNPHVSAVFSDVSMPVLDGFGLLERVRTSNDDTIANLPFIIITANDDDPDFVNRVNNAGGTDLITKPFKTKEIMACIDNYIHSDAQVDASPETNAAEGTISGNEVAEMLGLDSHEAPIPESNEIEATTITQEDVTSIDSISDDYTLSNETEALEVADTHDISDIEEPVDQYNDNFVEFTIDEDFFNDSIEQTHEVENNLVENIPEDNSSLQEPSFDRSLLNEELTLDNDLPSELTLESHVDESVSEHVTEESQETPKAKSRLQEIQEARLRASAIAIEASETDEQLTSAENARNATETSQIREELLRLREKEINNGTYAKDIDNSAGGKITSLFSGIMRIIKKILGIKTQ